MAGKKRKILMLSDHALSTSGVGTQSRHLINGLLSKGCWTIRQFGAAMKHEDYSIVKVNDDFIIKPIDGFGTKEMLRLALAIEKPDVLFIFTDPRFFYWLFEMEDEIHQICPIVWWHVWDNKPYPDFNDSFYESTDLINCHSHHTYMQLKDKYPEKTNFVPHAIPPDLFYEITDEKQKANWKEQILGKERLNHFTGFWVNRNARRKRPGDLLWAWKIFIDRIKEEEGHTDATLVMHTDPNDNEGPNLYAMTEMLNIKENVVFSPERIGFDGMNVYHNICDFTINISYAEGFGLSTLEAMMTSTPIIAPTTGGQTRQVIDYRDGSENGFALQVELQTLVGSQTVPYIYEDFVSAQTIAEKIYQMYKLGPEGREKLGQKAKQYADHEFLYKNTVDKWHDTMIETIDNWQSRYEKYTLEEI